jgi:membrane protein YdbS with pleckstrin-like domain
LFALSRFADWLLVPAVISLLAVPLAAMLARDRYRNLGHAVVENRLITQSGSLVRHRSVLALPGVIGVTLRQSVFQRRSGLISLTATTAAGAQRYLVTDLPDRLALDLAVRLVPECASVLTNPPAGSGTPTGGALLRDSPGVSRLPAESSSPTPPHTSAVIAADDRRWRR